MIPDPVREAIREGFLPILGKEELSALRAELESGGRRLFQGETTVPASRDNVCDLPCEMACPIGFIGMVRGLTTVGQVRMHFLDMIHSEKMRSVDVGAFLRWWDRSPKMEVVAGLLAEIVAYMGDPQSPC